LADALYGTGKFMGKASALTGATQVVSQLRSNQLVFSRGKKSPSLTILTGKRVFNRN
jgi:hypothetical protein